MTGTNKDGSTYSYIEDTASVAAYGRRTKVLSVPQIRPLANSVDAIQNAKDALKLAGEAYLARHIEPKTTYAVTLRGLRGNLRVGNSARLRYKGADRNGAILDVDEDLFVLDIRRDRDAKGNRTAELTIANIMQRRTTDTDIMVETINDVRALKLHVQPAPWWSENTYVKPIAGFATGQGGVPFNAQFPLEFDEQVTDIHKVNIRITTSPIFLNHRLLVDFAGSNSYEIADYIFNDAYPRGLSLYIDGQDVSSQFGGPWNFGLNAEFDESFDITDIILNSLDGIRSQHLIELGAVNEGGDPAFPAWRPLPPALLASVGENSSIGTVTMNIRVQGTAMAIVAE